MIFFLSTLDFTVGFVWLIFIIRVWSWVCLWIVHCWLSLLFSLQSITKNATEDTRLEQTKWDSHEYTTLSGSFLYLTCVSIFWNISCRNNKRDQIYVREPRCSRYLSNYLRLFLYFIQPRQFPFTINILFSMFLLS